MKWEGDAAETGPAQRRGVASGFFVFLRWAVLGSRFPDGHHPDFGIRQRRIGSDGFQKLVHIRCIWAGSSVAISRAKREPQRLAP